MIHGCLPVCERERQRQRQMETDGQTEKKLQRERETCRYIYIRRERQLLSGGQRWKEKTDDGDKERQMDGQLKKG